ncbi:MAG TPA: hypothetical protein VK614_06675 [Allosphingosinicella sp.]|nr:hypothetical protein [Allosphingosinicella sp.]
MGAAFALALLATAQPGTLSWSQLTTISDEALVRRMFGDLAAFPVVTSRPDPGPRRFARRWANVWFWTRARASDRDGLCETDRLIVRFEPAALALGGDDPPMRPSRFDLKTYYIVRDRGRAREGRRPEGGAALDLEAACAALDPTRDGVPADDSWQLMKAFELVAALGAGARAGRALAPLDCTGMFWNQSPPADEAACLRELSVLRETSAVWVDACQGGPPLGNCIRVQAPPWFIEFQLDQSQRPVRIVVKGIEDTSSIE